MHKKFIPFTFLLAACSGTSNNKPAAPATDSSIPAANPTTNADTLIINKKTAVFYWPDSVQMAKWKKEVGEEDFSTVADDWSYYMMTSREYLEKVAIPIENVSGKKAIKFVKTDQSGTVISLDTFKNYWGLFLFSPDKEPVLADIVSIEEAYKKYFETESKTGVKK
jgi:hypothetical protein